MRTAWCNRAIESGDAKDALAIGQDGHFPLCDFLLVAGSGCRHPSCWGLGHISIASQLDAFIRHAKSIVQVMHSTYLNATVSLLVMSASFLAFPFFANALSAVLTMLIQSAGFLFRIACSGSISWQCLTSVLKHSQSCIGCCSRRVV